MFRTTVAALTALAVVLPPAASASQFVDHIRGQVPVTLKVDRAGRAMVYYRKGTAGRHVLVAGATNPRQPSRAVRQVRFRIDYSGGWRTTRRPLWKSFPNACRAHDGAALPAARAGRRA